MSGKTLEELAAASPITVGSLLYIVDGDGNSRKVTAADLAQWIKTAESIVPTSEPWRGAQVKLSADLTLTTATGTTVSWASAVADTDSFWSAGAPTRLTVPAGVSRVRVAANVRWAAHATGLRSALIRKNGAVFDGAPSSYISTGTSLEHQVNLVSPAVAVADGDYFELLVQQNSGGNLAVTSEGRTWFAIEVVEVQP